MLDNRPIGVFDSGIGGLTIVKNLMSILPNEDIIYFGDIARIPLWDKIASYDSKVCSTNSKVFD